MGKMHQTLYWPSLDSGKVFTWSILAACFVIIIGETEAICPTVF